MTETATQQSAIVIGAGLAGLACAVALADRGLRVTVLEASARLGGRASSWTEPYSGDTVDIGPHVFHSEYRNVLAFLERLGTSHLICWQPGKLLSLASKPRALMLRHWHLPPPLSLLPSLLGASGLHLSDYLSMRRVALHAMRYGEEQAAALDAVSMLDFLRGQGVSEAMIDWWWRFAAMVAANVPLERCSAASLLRIHAQLTGYRGLHFGFAEVGLGELYTGQAVNIVRDAGGSMLAGTAAHAILGDDRARGVMLASGDTLYADHVVSALPPQALAPLLSPRWRARAPFDALDSFEPSPCICTYLWFDRQLPAARLSAHLWSPSRLNYAFSDLCQIHKGWQGRPTIMAATIIHSHRAHGMRDAEIVRVTADEIAECIPEAAQAKVVHAAVRRLPMAIPCPTVGFERKRPPAVGGMPGLVLAGDWTRTHLPCSMESAVKSGFLAAEAVLRAGGRPVTLALPPRPYDGIAGMVRAGTARRRGLAAGPET